MTVIERAADFGERLFLVLLAIPFAWVMVLSPSLTNMLLCVSEMIGVFFIVIRRSGPIRLGPLAVLAAFCGSAFPLLVRPGGQHLVPATASTACMILGLGLSIASKLYLNRSFGLVAANRGVKIRGPYRFVRHPMYLGYMLTELGFLLANATSWNLVVYLAAWSFQVLRMGEEESLLNNDDAYRTFAARVRNRLIPGVY